MTMIERVARRIAAEVDCVGEENANWRPRLDAAREMLKAIREPSKRMIREGTRAEDATSIYEGASVAEIVWSAMIDAALTEPQGEDGQ